MVGLLTPGGTMQVGDHMHEYFEIGCVIGPNSARGHNVPRWQSAMKEEEKWKFRASCDRHRMKTRETGPAQLLVHHITIDGQIKDARCLSSDGN